MNTSDRDRHRLLAAVAICLLGTTACGGGGSSTTTPSPSPEPAPAPAPAPIPVPTPGPAMNCMGGWSYANLYTTLRTPVRFWLSDTVANAAIDVEMQVQIRADDGYYYLSGRQMTGRLRLSLWAIPANGQIGKNGVVGHLIARSPATMVGGQGSGTDQLWHVSVAFMKLQASGTAPPAGNYCIALSADEETSTGTPPCATQDRFCLNAWYTFDNAVTFQ